MRRRDRYAAYLAALTVAVAIFAIGGAPRWAAMLAAGLATATVLPSLWSRREPVSFSPLLAFLAVAAALTLLQVIPLPAPVVRVLSPAKYDLVVQNAAALGDDPSWFIALSVDPSATLVELAKLVGYVMFAYSCLRLGASQQGRRWLAATVALAGAALAATAIGHELVGASTLYGVYTPQRATSFMAPLLNPNHLAAMLALATPVALGLAMGAPFKQRTLWIGVAMLCAGVCLLTQSRGGAIALVIGVVAAAGAYWLQRRRGTQLKSPLARSDAIAIGVTVLSLLLLFGLFTAGGTVRELQGTSASELRGEHGKVKAWKASKLLLRDYRWVGVGRGAFEPAFTQSPASERITFSHLENEYLQAAVDWGIPGAALLAILIVLTVLAARRRARGSPLEAGVIGGLVAIAAQNAVDFSLSLPGVAFAAISLGCIVVSAPLSQAKKRWLIPGRIGAVIVASAVIAAAASPLGRPARDETQAVEAAMADSSDHDELLARAIHVMQRHPSDYVAAGLVAELLFEARDTRSVTVANRALAMHPRHSGLHHLTAVMLSASQRPRQALIEYSLAVSYARRPEELIDEIIERFPSPEEAVLALPLEPRLLDRLQNILLSRKQRRTARLHLERYVLVHPTSHAAFLRLSALARKDGDGSAAVAAARFAYSISADGSATVALADALLVAGELAEAETLLRAAVKRSELRAETRVDMLISLAETELTSGRAGEAQATLHSALDLGGNQSAVHALLARVEEQLGNRHQADWERQKAQDLARPPSTR